MGSNLQAPTFTQVLSLRLLQFWGYEKLRAHVDRVAEFYRGKRDVFERLMHKHLDGLAEWNTPEAGMFFWSVFLSKKTVHFSEYRSADAWVVDTGLSSS